MQRWMLAIAFAALAGATVAAQVETKTEAKVKVKGGKEVHLIGCVEPASGPAEFMLTGVLTNEKTPGVVHNYYLVGKTDDLEKNIGHVMAIDGKALDRGKGESRSDNGAPLPFLDVTSAKLLRPSCP